MALGVVKLGGLVFAVDREGQIEAGKESTFGVECTSTSEVGFDAMPTAWLVDDKGAKVCDPVKGEGHGQHWHYTLRPSALPSKFAICYKDQVEEVGLFNGVAPCNGGIITPFGFFGAQNGFLELKLHDDAGDLELFLYREAGVGASSTPYDLPKDTVVRIEMNAPHSKSVELRVRNEEGNEDESGTLNMRDGKTNYFIFPGETGVDPSWLKGEKWRGVVQVKFDFGGSTAETDPFVLVPHTAL